MLMDDRYSIEVGDDFVEINGDLTIEETFDFLNFFEKKGFKSITGGWENSTLVMSRKGVEEKWEEIRQKENIELESMYQDLYKQSQEENRILKRRVDEVEGLIRTMFLEESEKVKDLRKHNEILIKELKKNKLQENEEVKKILYGFSYEDPEDEEDKE